MAEIYALLDPDSGAVRYIGKANNAVKRLQGHLRETRRDYPVYRWIRSLRAAGKVPVLEILQVCSEHEWERVERSEIAKARASGTVLLNVAEGGDQPYCDAETRASNGRKSAVARVSTEQKARAYRLKTMIGVSLKKGYVTEATKEKLRMAARLCPSLCGEWAAL